MRIKLFLIFAGLLLGLAAACTSGESVTVAPGQTNTPVPDQVVGVFAGSVNIGPFCPVGPCTNLVGDIYSSRQLQLQSGAGEDVLVELRRDGTFMAFVPVGEYSVSLSDCDYLGCSSVLPVTVVINEGEATDLDIDIDTGIRSAVPPSDQNTRLAEDLRAAGAEVEIGPLGSSSVFGFPAPSRNYTVDESLVHVYEFPTLEDAKVAAAGVGPDGWSTGMGFVDWTDSPHFFSSGKLIVFYIGNDVEILTLLEQVVGAQFAGSASVTPGRQEIRGGASGTAHRELSARLGVEPGDVQLVRSQLLEFSDGSLGCPDAGFSYTQAIIPGYKALYEVNGLRYPFHVSLDGRVFTDCRGESNVAVPFRLADDIVTVDDAFRMGSGTASHLGQEVILKTQAEAEAFLSGVAGLVEMDLELVDWEAEILVGTVITGSGCSFAVQVPSVFVHHLSKTVSVRVEAVQTGLCEKAWAVPVWLVVQEVPKDYSASFILSYVVN